MQETEKTHKKRGRKPFLLNEELAKKFEYLCSIGCSIEEISANLHIDNETLKKAVSKYYNANFSEVLAQKYQLQKTIIRAERMKRVKAGDTTMLIYLSKQLLGESDKQSLDITFPEIDYSNSGAPDFTKD